MKIAIDATIIRNEITGTGFYIINLLNGLAKIDSNNEYYIFGDKYYITKYLTYNKNNFTIINTRFRSRFVRVIWQNFFFPFYLKKINIDILHSPNYITPLFKLGFKVILTIHDITFLLFPQRYTIAKRLLFGKMLPHFIKIADKIISVSENTKEDILNYFNIKPDKITVTYQSYPDYYNEIVDSKEAWDIMRTFGIERDFILFVGMIEPRKNILSLLKAFINIDKKLDLDLVIVGGKGWYYEEIEDFIQNIDLSQLKNKIIFSGYIDEDKIKYFYKSAFMFAYPTYYEGFGLPPLQAMACGTPVITSNVSSLPEVVNDAAIKINPKNIDEISNAMIELWNNTKLREELIKKGLNNCKRFQLEEIAQKVLHTYFKLMH